MSEIKDRVIQLVDFKGIKREDFFDKIGASYSNFRGKSKKSGLSSDKIVEISSLFPDVNLEWLLTGKGNMIKVNNHDFEKKQTSVVNEPQEVYQMRTDTLVEQQDKIPFFEDFEAVAGLTPVFNRLDEQSITSYISIPNVPKCDGAIPIVGDSMYPLLKSGDIVLFKRIQNMKEGIFYGEMYLVSLLVDDEEFITAKYIHKSDKGDNYIKLVSQNSHHHPKDFHLKRIKALALIKVSIRYNSMI